MHEALYYTKLENQKVKCELCPWDCELEDGQTGICKVRTNKKGSLQTLIYDRVAALGTDPIEKKPLYHFHPGKNILSIGQVGCNLQCSFCQNHRISQCYASEFMGFYNISSEKIVAEALKTWNNIGIAYTYNEPFTFYEFLKDTAQLARLHDLKNVVVSNGYINSKPLWELLPLIDAFNIDLKAFDEAFYATYTKGQMAPVLNCLMEIKKSNTHLEITNLIIPELNDTEKEFEAMAKWISLELGKETPFHISRYFPQYKMNHSPTPIETMEKLYELAKVHLDNVFLGNVSDHKRSSTLCSTCQNVLIERNRYKTELKGLKEDGRCNQCGEFANVVF